MLTDERNPGNSRIIAQESGRLDRLQTDVPVRPLDELFPGGLLPPSAHAPAPAGGAEATTKVRFSLGAADDGGFVKIHCKKGTDEILGATICSERATVRKTSRRPPRHRRDVDSLVLLHRHAGESISELTVAIQSRIGLGALGMTIHPYPTVAEAIQGCGIGYNRTQWATVDNSDRKKLEKLLGALKPYALGVLGGLALAALARR